MKTTHSTPSSDITHDIHTLVLSRCNCGGKAKGRGRTLECSNRKCGTVVMLKTRDQSVVRWNEIMKMSIEE